MPGRKYRSIKFPAMYEELRKRKNPRTGRRFGKSSAAAISNATYNRLHKKRRKRA